MAGTSTPLVLGLIGSGRTSVKNASQLIADLIDSLGPNTEDVTFVAPVTTEGLTPTVEAVLEWAVEEGYKYVAVIDDTSEDDKSLTDFIKAAAKVTKVAKPYVRVITEVERGDDGRLLMLWNDEDDASQLILERAVDRDIVALDLTSGLEEGLQRLRLAGDTSTEEAPPAKAEEPDDEPKREPVGADPAAEFAPADDLDSLGVRKLRDMVEEELGFNRRKVGQMGKPDCITALREHRHGVGGGGAAAAAPVDDDPADDVFDADESAAEERRNKLGLEEPQDVVAEAGRAKVTQSPNSASQGQATFTASALPDSWLRGEAMRFTVDLLRGGSPTNNEVAAHFRTILSCLTGE